MASSDDGGTGNLSARELGGLPGTPCRTRLRRVLRQVTIRIWYAMQYALATSDALNLPHFGDIIPILVIWVLRWDTKATYCVSKD